MVFLCGINSLGLFARPDQRVGFDGLSKIMGTDSLIQTEWLGRAESTVPMTFLRIWLGSESILWDKFAPYGSDIANPEKGNKI